MTILPTPPTDNLYKFIAITGLWLTIIIMICLIYLKYVSITYSKNVNNLNSITNHQNKIDKIDKKILSLNSGNTFNDKARGKNSKEGIIKELDELNIKKNKLLQSISQLQSQNKDNLKNTKLFDYFVEINLIYVFLFIGTIGISMLWLGFRLWYRNIQKIDNKMKQFELELKSISLQTMKEELKIKKTQAK